MKKTTLTQNVLNKDRAWIEVDAAKFILGKLAVAIADALTGKARVDYTPHSDMGDYVVVINAEKVQVSRKKEEDKKYYSHSGYMGKLKVCSLKKLRQVHPKDILLKAVSGMLPKNRLRKARLKRLFLVIGDKNPHKAQIQKQLQVNK